MKAVKNQNFISTDGLTARNSYGDFFSVGERVGHQSENAGTAVITRFEAVKKDNEITAFTTEGSAHLDFVIKLEKEQITGVGLISEERDRHESVEGWTEEHDSEHTDESMAKAAACYAMPESERVKYQSFNLQTKTGIPRWWPWDVAWWKPCPGDRIRELVKAGALIAAEIDRLLRKQDKQS